MPLRHHPSTDLHQHQSQQTERPLHRVWAVVVAQVHRGTRLAEQFVERWLLPGRHPAAHRGRAVGQSLRRRSRTLAVVTRGEDGLQQHVGSLGHRQTVDVVARDHQPAAQPQELVDVTCHVGRHRTHLIDRGGLHTSGVDGLADAPQRLLRRRRRRRSTLEQRNQVGRGDAPLPALVQQHPDGAEVERVQAEVLAPHLQRVRQRALEVRQQTGVIERGEIDRLDRQVGSLDLFATATRARPFGQHRTPRALGQHTFSQLPTTTHLGQHTADHLQRHRRRRLLRRLVGTDQRPHPRIAEPVHELHVETLDRGTQFAQAIAGALQRAGRLHVLVDGRGGSVHVRPVEQPLACGRRLPLQRDAGIRGEP